MSKKNLKTIRVASGQTEPETSFTAEFDDEEAHFQAFFNRVWSIDLRKELDEDYQQWLQQRIQKEREATISRFSKAVRDFVAVIPKMRRVDFRNTRDGFRDTMYHRKARTRFVELVNRIKGGSEEAILELDNFLEHLTADDFPPILSNRVPISRRSQPI